MDINVDIVPLYLSNLQYVKQKKKHQQQQKSATTAMLKEKKKTRLKTENRETEIFIQAHPLVIVFPICERPSENFY